MGIVLKVIGGASGIAAIWFAVWGLDKLGIIDRHAFEWGDFATLATGAFAVIGAVWVGRKQVAISDQQTKILDRQTALQSLTFKAELYDKRVKVYTSVKKYCRTIWSVEEFRDISNTQDFLIALEASRFLFSEDVYKKVREIYSDTVKFSSLTTTLAKLENDSKAPTANILNKQSDLSDVINQHINDLTEMVMPYLRVDEHTAAIAD